MQSRLPEENENTIVLQLDVSNHPGVMSHICSLFARRAYNLEAIACVPMGLGDHSRIWLMVNEMDRLEQVVKQIQKLPDVQEVSTSDGDHPVFADLYGFVKQPPS